MRKLFYALILFFTLTATDVFAADSATPDANTPVDISAQKSLVWNRTQKSFTASRDVIVKKGTADIRCDNLTAHYDDADGGIKIQHITAVGHVALSSPPYRAYGDHATYTVATGDAVLTGDDLRIETDTERLTATDKIEYIAAKDQAIARGHATARKETNTLAADTLTAFFTTDKTGKRAVQKITADGAVTITTAKEVIHGNTGVYDVISQKATLEGPVKISQGQSWLEGTRATVDMTTGISQLFGQGNAATEGRVRGVFYPKAKTPEEKKTAP